MNTPQSPFAATHALQEEQREGCAPARKPLAPTPRTDEAITFTEQQSAYNHVEAGFARRLERELAEKDAKITEQAAQIAHMAAELRLVRGFVTGPHECLGDRNMTSEQAQACIAHALNGVPPVVPLDEAKALADALENLRDEQNGPPLERHKEHWQAAYDNANKVLAEFTAKHPQP